MAKGSPLKTVIMERLAAVAASFGVDLIDVEMTREQEKKILRLIIDKTGGVGIEDCVSLSEAANPIIADELGITDHDVFEVQSAGLDRKLTETADLIRHLGAEVDVKLYQAVDGNKVIEGVLAGATDDTVTLRLADGSERQIARKDAASIRRAIRF